MKALLNLPTPLWLAAALLGAASTLVGVYHTFVAAPAHAQAATDIARAQKRADAGIEKDAQEKINAQVQRKLDLQQAQLHSIHVLVELTAQAVDVKRPRNLPGPGDFEGAKK